MDERPCERPGCEAALKVLLGARAAAEARAEKYREAILSALDTSTLGAINYHFGPNARVAVSRESIAQYERVAALRDLALAGPEEQLLEAEQTSRTPADQQTDTQSEQGEGDGEVDGATPDAFNHDGSLNDSGRADSQREAEDVEAWRERRQVFEGPDS